MSTLPRSASRYAAAQRAEIGAATSAIARLWRRMGRDFDASWASIEPQVWAVLDASQARVAEGAVGYVPDVLAETDQRTRPPQYAVDPRVLVGTAGDGLGTDSLAYGAVVRAREQIATGATWQEGLAVGGRWLTTATATLLSDTGRTAERMSAHAHGSAGFVRMLQPPSCGRCVILAGKRVSTREPFLRHPGCDCRHIPASESVAEDLSVNPAEYLDGLSDDELAKALGSRANAQAWRDGADPAQLINAYRRSGAVRAAQVYDRRVKYTTEATTRRGWAHSRMGAGRRRAPRLMPESIYQIATSRDEALRLLRLYGWIL